MRGRGRLRLAAIAASVIPFFLLISLDPSRAVAAYRQKQEQRRQTVAMAERIGLDPQALLDPEAYQRKLARDAAKERDLQVHWMRERTKPDQLALDRLHAEVESTEDAYAVHALAGLADDLSDLDAAMDDQFAGKDATTRLVALERSSLRHWPETLERYDRMMQKRLAGLPRSMVRRHEAFMKESRQRFNHIARGVAKATRAAGRGQAANLHSQPRARIDAILPLRNTVAEAKSTRSTVARPLPPAERPPRVIAQPLTRTLTERELSADPMVAERADRQFRPSDRQVAQGQVRSAGTVPTATAHGLLAHGSTPSAGGAQPLARLPQPATPDTEATLDAPLTDEIVAMASSLDYDPIKIFNYVHDTIDTEIYLGSRKGAIGTLAEKAGNDVDQASLLIALLRAAGYPARYERVVVRLAPQQWRAYTGVDKVQQAASMLATAGLPASIADIPDPDTRLYVSHVEVPMMAVRAYVPYSNYRGVNTGQTGESGWAPLLPALKGYQVQDAIDLRAGAEFNFTQYLSALTTASPLEVWEQQLRDYILANGLECETLASAQPSRTIIPEALPYLRAELPAKTLSSLGTMTELPESLRDRVQLSIRQPNGAAVVDYDAALVSLYGATITLTYEPASPEDAAVIDGFGGLEATPLYLVKLAATLRVDGSVVATGPAQVPGVDNRMSVTFYEAGESVAVVPHTSRVGSQYVWAFDAGTVPSERLDDAEIALAEAPAGTDARELARLQAMALRYLVGYNRARDEVTGLFQSRFLHDPSELLVSYELNVTSTGGAPISGTRDMVLFDVGRTQTTPFAVDRDDRQRGHQKLLLGHQASALEHITPGVYHGPNMYSAVRFVQQAHDAGVTVYDVSAEQVDSVLPLLAVDDGIKQAIADKAKPGRRLRIPQTTFTPPQFRPMYGFISYDVNTGAAEYSFNGVFDGGGGLVSLEDLGYGPGCFSCTAGTDEAGSTVILSRGNYFHEEEDLSVSAPGVPIVFTRRYHSYFSAGGGQLGPGWIHSYAHHIRRTPTGLIYASEAGEWVYRADGMGGYIEPAGFKGRIAETADGFTLTFRDGRVDRFDAAGKLLSRDDLNGNQVTMQHDSAGRLATVTDATGRAVLTFTYDVNGQLERLDDVAGRSVLYDHDAAGDLVSVTNVNGDTRTFAYDADHHMVERSDYRGNAWSLSYDAQGRWARTIDPLGGSYRASYDPVRGRALHWDRRASVTSHELTDRGELAAKTDALGNRTAYQYDARGNMVERVNPRGAVTSYAYDVEDNNTEMVSPSGVVTSYSYGAHERLETTVEDVGGLERRTTNGFDGDGNMITMTDALGQVSTFTYGLNGMPSELSRPGGATTTVSFDAVGNLDVITDPEGGVTALDYNPAGHLLRMEDPSHSVTSMTADASGQVLTTSIASGQRTVNTYDADGNLLAATDAAGAVTTYRYDALGRRVETEDALAQVTRTAYDEEGAVVASMDAEGNQTTFAYDSVGRLLSTTDASGATSHTGYCAGIGQACETVDAAGNITLRSFDIDGRISSITDPSGYTTTLVYDALGRQVMTVDPSGRTSETTLDTAGRVTAVIDALGNRTHYTYDERGNRTSYIDADGNTTSFTYDLANRVLSQTNPLGNPTGYAYDSAGNLIEKQDANGNLVTYEYEDSRRLTARIYADGTRHEFQYDERGNKTWESSPSITRSFAYDALGRLETVSDQRFAEPKVLRYSYDARGNRSSMTLEPEMRRTEYHYDERGLLSELVDPDGDVVHYQYDDLGRRTQLRYPNGIIGTYTYNQRSETTGIVWTRVATGQTVSASLYTYDERGNRTSKTYEDGGVESYEYDAVSRLTAATYPGGRRRVTYEYDGLGNRLRMVESLLTDTDQPAAGCNRVLDPDCDGVPTELDNCPTTYNPGQENSDGQSWSDTFDDGSLLPDYTPVEPSGVNNPDWHVENNRLEVTVSRGAGAGTTFSGPYLLRNNFDDQGSLRLGATLKMVSPTDQGIGLAFRWQDVDNHYRFHNNKAASHNFQRIEKVEAGAVSVLAENSTPVGEDLAQRFIVEADGPSLKVYQGDTPTLQAEDATFTSGGVGLYSWRSGGARYDDVVVTNADPRGDACDPCPAVADGNCAAACDDTDGDGYGSTVGACGKLVADCSVNNAEVNPGAEELCDGIDNDCDGSVDERCGAEVTDYSYNGFNQLLESVDNEGVTTFAYDNNGNQVERAAPSRTTGMVYDLDDRMVELREPARTSVFAYAPDGIMVARDAGGDRGARDLVVDVQQQLEVAEYDAAGDWAAGHTFNPAGVDELVATADTSTGDGRKTYGILDGLHSVVGLADARAGATSLRRYDAFGVVASQVGAHSAVWGFTGRSWPAESGDARGYYRQRWYPAGTGRFTQSDPLGDVDGPNVYRYAVSNPVRWTDPTGSSIACLVAMMMGIAYIYLGIKTMLRAMRPFVFEVFDLGVMYMLEGFAMMMAVCGRGCGMAGATAAGGRTRTIESSRGRMDSDGWSQSVSFSRSRRRGGSSAAERFERFGSRQEALVSVEPGPGRAHGGLVPRPGHEGQPKWIGEPGTVRPARLGRRSNYTHRIDLEMEPGTRNWLKQFEIKPGHEPGRYAVPADKLGEFNARILGIRISPR